MSSSRAARSSSRRPGTPVSGWPCWPSSAATSVSLAPDKVSEDKQNVLRVPTAPSRRLPDGRSRRTIRTAITASPTGWSPRSRAPGSPDQYSNPQRPRQPLRDHRPGDLGRHRRQGHPLRRRGREPAEPSPAPALPQEVSGGRVKVIGADPRPVYSGGTGRPYWSRASAGLLARPPTTRRWPTASSGVRRRFFDMTRRLGPRGKPCWSADRGWRWSPRSEGRRGGRAGRPGGAAAGRRPRATCPRSSTTPDVVPRVSCGGRWTIRCRSRNVGDVLRGSPARFPTWSTPTRRRRCATRSGSCASTGVADAGRRRRAAGDGRRGGRKRLGTRNCCRQSSRAAPSWRRRGPLHMSPPLPLIGAGELVSATAKMCCATGTP